MSQYLRKFSLIIADKAGEGLDLSDLHCTFDIKKTCAQEPNTGDITIYNLAPNTAAQIKKEFQRIVIQAGYQDNYGLIFDGNIKQVKAGRENGVDSYLSISAGDGDKAYTQAVVSKTIAAGATPGDVAAVAAQPMQGLGVKSGTISIPGNALPRGKVLHGSSRDHLRRISKSSGSTWSIQDGVIQIVQAGKLAGNQAVLLSPSTGLVDSPEETEGGITITCLLNPMLRINSLVNLKNTDFDGPYSVMAIEYKGDNRGNGWHCIITGKKYA